MNPVTEKLITQVDDPQIAALVEHWDAVEALVIRVYRAGQASVQDEADHRLVVTWLRSNHPSWRGVLEPYWRSVTIKGAGPATVDPFETFLRIDTASEFVNNWEAMRALPAIRQATNQWLLDVIGGKV